MSAGAARAQLLSGGWAKFEESSVLLNSYLRSSENEFVSLIRALDACWNVAENVQKATARLAELTGVESDSETVAIRESMLEGCKVFRKFLDHIQVVSRQLDLAAQETRAVLVTSNHLREDLAPLNHIAFHFRLESCRLSPEDTASILGIYDDMREVLGGMTQSGDSQDSTLSTILGKLSTATQTVEQASSSYADRATVSEKNIYHNLELLLTVPPDLADVRSKAAAVGASIADSIREAVKVLQGHDAIRQRLEHILGALARVRTDSETEPGNALLLQRHQAKCVLEMIVNTGSRIEVELNGVIRSAQGLAGDSSDRAAAEAQVEKFEEAVDRLASISAGVAELLTGEMKIGNFVLNQIEPIDELLNANSGELRALAHSMKRLKRLALNVLISADKMPSARGIGVLGSWTSEAAERVLKLAKELDEKFGRLGATVESQAASITADVQEVESCRSGLLMPRAYNNLRNSRRDEYDEVNRLNEKARELQQKTEDLLKSLKFVDEGSRLLGDLDPTLEVLLTLYPKPEKPLDLNAASVGYTMQGEREVHAAVFGGDEKKGLARLSEPAEGQDYGDNVELF
jgi:hypothetical protein